MPGGYHMTVEFPEDSTPEQRTEMRAEAFRTGLEHAATDAEFRLRMVLGESYSDYQRVIDTLREKLGKGSEAVRLLAAKWAGRPDLLAKPIHDPTVAHVQHIILIDATNGGSDVPRGTADVIQIEHETDRGT